VRDAVFWFDTRTEALASLQGTVSADVVVVGGGMMGLFCARALVAQGQRVCLVEAGTCGGGASGRSSGLITPDSELELQDLVQQFGSVEGPRLWEFALGGVNAIRQAVVENRIDCDAQSHDALFVATTQRGAKLVADEANVRRRFGYRAIHHSRESLPTILGSSAYFGALRFSGTFSIDGYRACTGLRQVLLAAGARIFEGSPVTRILENGVETPGGSVRAAAVMVCADRCLPSLGMARSEIYHVQTFLAVSEPLGNANVERLFPQEPLLVWDTDVFYKYFRLTGDRRLLIGGGTLASTYARRERHRPEKVARLMQGYLAERFPGLEVRFVACWPGLIGITKDFAPVVGRHPRYPSVHFAAGAAGLPWAAALGIHLAERLRGHRDKVDELLSDGRTFSVGRRLQAAVGAPAAFALSHGIQKFWGK
jgi:gamma-glutamylputrescine oxidase